jgi:threonine dehydrogenase-like Zn-dependent dehydrogenase
MLALVKTPSKIGIALEDLPIPEFSPYEILIKVKAVGICGSDLRMYNKVGSERGQKRGPCSYRDLYRVRDLSILQERAHQSL